MVFLVFFVGAKSRRQQGQPNSDKKMKNREIIALIASIGAACPLLAACWSLEAVNCPETAGKINCYEKMEVLELSAGTVYQLPSTKLANTMRTSWTGFLPVYTDHIGATT